MASFSLVNPTTAWYQASNHILRPPQVPLIIAMRHTLLSFKLCHYRASKRQNWQYIQSTLFLHQFIYLYTTHAVPQDSTLSCDRNRKLCIGHPIKGILSNQHQLGNRKHKAYLIAHYPQILFLASCISNPKATESSIFYPPKTKGH